MDDDETNPELGLRRSQRDRRPTEISAQYKDELVKQGERAFSRTYEVFKLKLRSIRENIRRECTEEELYEFQQDLESDYDKLESVYVGLRSHTPPQLTHYQRKIDSALACKKDILTHLSYRITEIGVKDFDLNDEIRQQRYFKKPYAASVYSAATSTDSRSVMNQAVEAAADLACKKVRIKSLALQEEERSHLAQLEMQKRQSEEAVNAQRRKLELLKAQHEAEESSAKLKVLNVAAMEEDDAVSELVASLVSDHGISSHQPSHTLNPRASEFSPHIQPTAGNLPAADNSSNEFSLAAALANAIDKNRLPVPTPKIFTGNPIEFLSFKRSFKTLIEGKGVSVEERLYYLQQYVGGDAREAIAGCFFGTNETDYQQAWDLLERRFGHPFRVQEAFRDKLDKWPKVSPRDGVALQRFADFLRSCLDAMPHIKGLDILNDCKENQRMTSKLPDWAVTRWSRIVSESLSDVAEYPTFKRFVMFVEKEARAACHPVVSVSAVRSAASWSPSNSPQDSRGKPVRNLATEQMTPSSKESFKSESRKLCSFCKAEHYLSDCMKFAEMSIEDRQTFLKQDKRCFACLRIGHLAKQCRTHHTCVKCKGRHPTVLHDDNRERRYIQQPAHQNSSQNQDEERVLSLHTENGQPSTTNVVPVWISTVSNPQVEKLVYALLDTQSDSTFIDQRVCEALCAATDPVKLKLSTILGKDVTVACERARGLQVRGYTSAQHISLPPAYTRDFIPLDREHIPTSETAKAWGHLTSIASEIPTLLDCEVGLLIGYNCSTALTPRHVVTGETGQPYALKTDLGWSIVGGLASVDSTDVTGYCHRVSLKEAPPVTPRDVLSVLESDFKDSSYGDISTSQEDIQFLQILERSILKNVDGHFEMPLPFRTRPNVPNNRKLAEKRLSHLKRHLDSDTRYREHYTQFVEGMLQDGHAEPAEDEARPGEVHYIPHHGVYHPKKPDKLRVVFDCSAKYQGESLNSYLLSGPDLTNNLFGVLCRFRQYPIAVMCDVEKMFHQFHVKPEDRDYLRFLWWEGGDTNKQPSEYRMKVHLFGAVSSPGCANFGLKYLSKMFEEDYPVAAQFLRHDCYVDDGVTSLQSVEDAVKLIQEARELCSLGRLHLHKFVSNNRSVLESIPVSERATEVQQVDLSKDDLPSERTLGVQWNIESDLFTFEVQLKDRPNTRRGILSVVASIYDPFGFISPFVLEGKAILQNMCKRGTSWDDPVPEDLLPRWERWKSDIQNLKEVRIPRCYKPVDFSPVMRTELHHFSDASTDGYGACSYLRFVSQDRAHCTLIASKARVSSTKVVTIPRMELTAAVLAVKMSCKLKKELQIDVNAEYFWCDSQVVLSYIMSDAKRFHVFVANRVQFIRDHTKVDQWQYISTKVNPADHASRGLSVEGLLRSNWFTGPELLQSVDVVRNPPIEPSLMPEDPEIKVQVLSIQSENSSYLLKKLSYYSEWDFVTRIVARICRLVHSNLESKCLTTEELNQASIRIVRLVQEIEFRTERRALSQGQEVACTSKLYSLNPYIVDGVIRIGGRLRNSSLSLNEKHPLVVPRDGHITQLIVGHYHKQICHQGRSQTLNHIRSQGFWILGGSKVIADFIRNCVHCRRLRRPVEEQKMADLPEDRVELSPPFSFCGMDCFGPFVTKCGRKECKRYGLLFTCMCSRAVHIELLQDMTTDSFIIALRSFIAIRGTVVQIRSDQGSNFIGASNELTAALKELDINRICTLLTKKQCTFVFNAPYSSHVGGIWERQIRSVRNVLNYTVGLCPGRLDDSSLRCLFYEAMLIINSRPLTAIGSDPDEEPLTPNHLITMKPNIPLPPPGKFVKEDMYARKRWRRIQYLAEQFWSRWKKEYILNLSERQKWNTTRRNIQVGDVVMLMDTELPRTEWPTAIVVEAHKDGDGLVRRIKARLGTANLDKYGRAEKQASILERPIQKVIILLETN